MKCLKINQVYDYLEGELSLKEKKEVEKHLSICPKCFQIFKERKILLESISELTRFEPPADLVERIMNRIIRPKLSWVQVLIYSLSTSFIFLLFFAVLLRATEESISSIFLNVTHFFLKIIKYSTVFLAKLMKVVTLLFHILEHLISQFFILLKFLAILELKFQVIFVGAIIILTGLIFLLYFPFKKILVKI